MTTRGDKDLLRKYKTDDEAIERSEDVESTVRRRGDGRGRKPREVVLSRELPGNRETAKRKEMVNEMRVLKLNE